MAGVWACALADMKARLLWAGGLSAHLLAALSASESAPRSASVMALLWACATVGPSAPQTGQLLAFETALLWVRQSVLCLE